MPDRPTSSGFVQSSGCTTVGLGGPTTTHRMTQQTARPVLSHGKSFSLSKFSRKGASSNQPAAAAGGGGQPKLVKPFHNADAPGAIVMYQMTSTIILVVGGWSVDGRVGGWLAGVAGLGDWAVGDVNISPHACLVPPRCHHCDFGTAWALHCVARYCTLAGGDCAVTVL